MYLPKEPITYCDVSRLPIQQDERIVVILTDITSVPVSEPNYLTLPIYGYFRKEQGDYVLHPESPLLEAAQQTLCKNLNSNSAPIYRFSRWTNGLSTPYRLLTINNHTIRMTTIHWDIYQAMCCGMGQRFVAYQNDKRCYEDEIWDRIRQDDVKNVLQIPNLSIHNDTIYDTWGAQEFVTDFALFQEASDLLHFPFDNRQNRTDLQPEYWIQSKINTAVYFMLKHKHNELVQKLLLEPDRYGTAARKESTLFAVTPDGYTNPDKEPLK